MLVVEKQCIWLSAIRYVKVLYYPAVRMNLDGAYSSGECLYVMVRKYAGE